MNKYVLASGNVHKMQEIESILGEFGIELSLMKDVGLENLEIIEDGNTFEENSFIKAKVVMDKTGRPTIADDSGLMVDFLNGAPGVYSARYAGENVTYEDNNKKLLLELLDVDNGDRGAKFVTVITLLFPNGDKIVARGEVKGKIAKKNMGNGGFGYDPLFIVESENKSFAEMSQVKKNRISHRANALKVLRIKLKKYFGE